MSGRLVALLSAGIDSPVASWRMMRRGALVVGVHFSGRPQTNDASERLVLELGERLALTGGLARIYIVPFGDLQREISLLVPARPARAALPAPDAARRREDRARPSGRRRS